MSAFLFKQPEKQASNLQILRRRPNLLLTDFMWWGQCTKPERIDVRSACSCSVIVRNCLNEVLEKIYRPEQAPQHLDSVNYINSNRKCPCLPIGSRTPCLLGSWSWEILNPIGNTLVRFPRRR
ncbi:hypothetical protein JZ751_024064 [Albula glossodonta]|uniref:Uncharacterized protein n=1 Tax=Albula glossodonta TaxID=121402 RepID=A0A8T2NFR4_9TELE|nr:hypothetical protein JZ751_024064 [Albula glossodonta]